MADIVSKPSTNEYRNNFDLAFTTVKVGKLAHLFTAQAFRGGKEIHRYEVTEMELLAAGEGIISLMEQLRPFWARIPGLTPDEGKELFKWAVAEQSKKIEDAELAKEVEDWESGKIKPTDPDWKDAPEACTPQAPLCEGLVDVDIYKYPRWPVRLPREVYAYLEIAAAQEDAYLQMGEVGAHLQFEPTRQRSWEALSPLGRSTATNLMAKRKG